MTETWNGLATAIYHVLPTAPKPANSVGLKLSIQNYSEFFSFVQFRKSELAEK